MAAYELTGSQVQFALERGLPAIIGNFVSRQLPFPSLSFDMVHCAQCGIAWDSKGTIVQKQYIYMIYVIHNSFYSKQLLCEAEGMFLIEVDRILKPGGYFVLTSPTSGSRRSSLGTTKISLLTPVEEFTKKLCWSLVAQQEETLIWQKTDNAECYTSR